LHFVGSSLINGASQGLFLRGAEEEREFCGVQKILKICTGASYALD